MTGGNPFFVAEVGLAVADRHAGATPPVTASVRDAIGARLDRLSPQCVQLLRAASIAGREFSVAVVAAMVNLPVLSCLGPLDKAVTAGLIEPASTPGEHRFPHALVRDAIEAGLGTPERVRLHRMAAEAVEEFHAGRLGPHLFDLARHWAVAAVQGDRARAMHWIGRAGDEAMRRLAYEEGARLFRLALDVGAGELDEVSRCRLLLALGRALHLSIDFPGALEVCREAAALARDIGRADLMAEAALVMEPTLLPEADLTLKQLCENALAALATEHAALRARVTARFAEACHYLGDLEPARPASEELLAVAEPCGDPGALVAALHARQLVCSGPDGLAERAALAERMLAVGREMASPRTQLWGHLWRIDVALERGDLAGSAQEMEATAWCAQEVRGPLARWQLLRSQATLAQAQARFDDARRLAAQAFTTRYYGPVELWLGIAAAHSDLLGDAVVDLEQAIKASAVSGAAGFQAEAQYELAAVLARRARPGDLARARGLVAESARRATAFGMGPIAAKARRLTDRLDAAPSAPLTAREREVAALVARGLTNREIAERLYLSERTAQNHVQHILTKLDLPNRSQIAVWITGQT